MDNNELNNNVENNNLTNNEPINNTENNNIFADSSLNNFGTDQIRNEIPNNVGQESNNTVNVDLSSQIIKDETGNIFDNNQSVKVEPQQINTEPVTPSSDVPVEKKKKSKGPIIFIVILILIILGLVGYICYDKFIDVDKENEQKNKVNENTATEEKSNDKEYVSFDTNQYFKLKEDGTYEIKLSDNNVQTGKYSIENDVYTLENNLKVTIKEDYAEISGLDGYSNFVFYNVLLLNQNKIEDIKNKITNSIESYVNEISKNQDNAPEIENINVNIGECYKYKIDDTDVNNVTSEHINCVLKYNIYFKDYNPADCNSKYLSYTVSSGTCENDYVSNGFMASFNENDNYKILSVYTGM